MPNASGGPNELLERSDHLATLGEFLATVVRKRRGGLVFVRGEAGVGKTALLRRFRDERRGSARFLWGSCDALFTPRPLGPLVDVARTTGGGLEELVRGEARPHEVAATIVEELSRRVPTILVLEDVHRADEATLDVLRLLGRRIEEVPALLLASYRDEELDRAHPLRIVLGELSTGEWIRRLTIQPLSQAAVAELADPHGVDPLELYRTTGGNGFFVTEALAAPGDQIPATVRDAVLARAARLGNAARALLEAVAIVPQPAELWLLEALAHDEIDKLEECLASGMLAREAHGVGFRHELARLAVEDEIPPDRRVVLHRKALAALAAPPVGAPDLARLAHHAEAAGDFETVLRVAPQAAVHAVSLGAHREAAAQYARALRFAGTLALEARTDLLRRRAHECYLTDQTDDAVEALDRAIEGYRILGNGRREGDSLRELAQMLWSAGHTDRAEAAARQAVTLLEAIPLGQELAMAYAVLASRCMNADDFDGAIDWGTQALRIAERLDDDEIRSHAMNTIGTTEFLSGIPEGLEKLERSWELASRGGYHEQVARGFTNAAWAAVRRRSYAAIDSRIESWVEYCAENGLDLWRLYLLAYRAWMDLDQARWMSAADSAALVLRVRRSSSLPRLIALMVLGLVRARRGDPDVWTPLDEARALAEGSGELQRVAPVAAARAEARWLEGAFEAIAVETGAAFQLASTSGDPWFVGQLASWRRRAGLDDATGAVAEPYALEMTSDWERAAECWTTIGCSYEAALALAEADDDDASRTALERFHALGARPAAAYVARRLRERGARGVPRGPRRATRSNPVGLTPREVEVLGLLAQGLHNTEIAERLFLAEKTVDHHVSAVLRKLGVRSRGQASAEAARIGLLGKLGDPSP